MNFDSDIPPCNASVVQESLKRDFCDMFQNEKEIEEDWVREDKIGIKKK